MTDKEMLQVALYRWLFNTEVDLQNHYIDLLNNFSKFNQHDISDYFKLYEAELKFSHFKQFSNDLIKLLEIG